MNFRIALLVLVGIVVVFTLVLQYPLIQALSNVISAPDTVVVDSNARFGSSLSTLHRNNHRPQNASNSAALEEKQKDDFNERVHQGADLSIESSTTTDDTINVTNKESLSTMTTEMNETTTKAETLIASEDNVATIENQTATALISSTPHQTNESTWQNETTALFENQTVAKHISGTSAKAPRNKTSVSVRHHNKTVPSARQDNETQKSSSIFAQDCLKLNSKAWLKGPRIGNAYEPLSTHSIFHHLLQGHLLRRVDTLTDRTLCHSSGRFRNSSLAPQQTWDPQDEALVMEWEFKLLYLAIHHWHHTPARDEYRIRRHCYKDHGVDRVDQALQQNYGIHPLDYECKGFKFIATSVPQQGLGAALRLGTVPHVLMGIATGRIPLIVGNVQVPPAFNRTAIPSFLQPRWVHASCPRGDLQCVFLPTSPCVLTVEDLQNATLLKEFDARPLRRGGVLRQDFANTKVLIVEARVSPPKFDVFSIHKVVRKKLHKHASEIVHEWWSSVKQEAKYLPRYETLQAAVARILEPDRRKDDPRFNQTYPYGHRYFRMAHAILLYLMRPNFEYTNLMKQHLQQAVPKGLDLATTVGIPIRASDKCAAESTCLSVDQYMELAAKTMNTSTVRHTVHNSTVRKRGSVIITSEDAQIMAQTLQYKNKQSYPLHVITNDEDIKQSTGTSRAFGDKADQVTLSSLVALQVQLLARTVIGNCCSNFHLMLFDFVSEGCGAVASPQYQCLQEAEDPQYRVCCGWTRTQECDKTREAYGKIKAASAEQT